jgi:hypothetical protein
MTQLSHDGLTDMMKKATLWLMMPPPIINIARLPDPDKPRISYGAKINSPRLTFWAIALVLSKVWAQIVKLDNARHQAINTNSH